MHVGQQIALVQAISASPHNNHVAVQRYRAISQTPLIPDIWRASRAAFRAALPPQPCGFFTDDPSAQGLLKPLLLLITLSLGAATNAAAQTRDVAGARDFPASCRFGGSGHYGLSRKDF